MPRKARNTIITNYSHIIVQGIEKSFIFKERYFKELYLDLMKNNLKDSDMEMLGYSVMDNHTHMILYLNDLNNSNELGRLMQKVNTGFAVNYNKINNRVGYVFRNRYYLQPITSQRQLYNCLVYIHRNPIKANMVSKYEDYEFSSYKEFVGKQKLITPRGIKLIFGSDTDYLKTFEEIHKNKIIEDINDIKEVKNVIYEEKVLKDFFNKYGKSIDKIRKDEVLLRELVTQLREKSGLSLRKMESILGIGKDKISKALKEK